MRIIGTIGKLVEDFPSKVVEPVKGWRVNQYELLNRIELYSNSQFETGNIDSQGMYKFFYNINQFPLDIEAKATDIDTKDYLFIPESGRSEDIIGVFLMKKEFDIWAKEKKWGVKLNEIVRNRPKYGTVVTKRVKKTIKIVNIHNIINDPSVEYLWKGPVIENHIWTQQELEMMPYEEDKKQEIIDLYAKDNQENQILGREFYGWIKLSDIDDKYDDRLAYCVVVVSGVEKKKKQGDQEVRLGTVLWWKEIKAPSEDSMGDFPYRESHRRKIPGRWLGIGKVEELLDPQIRMNELQNIKSKGLHLSALQVFQSRDMTVARNLLEDTLNGEILRVDSEITPLQVKDVNLSHFQQEEQRWDKNIQERSFTFESETGESLPSGTPFRLGALLAAKSGGFFDLMREDIGLFLSDIFYEVMIPLFKADRKKKHSLVLPVDEKGMMDRIKEFTEWILQSELEGGNIPRDIDERRRIIIEKIVKAGFLAIEIPESRYDDVEAKIKLVITDEQIDLNQKLESISSFVQLIASNPAILQVEPLKNLVFGAMQMAGINPADYGLNVPIQPMQAPVEQQSGQELPVPGNVTTQTTQ